MVSVSDVRKFLNDVSDQELPDSVIQTQIDIATFRVNARKSSQASANDVEQATLIVAGYLSYLAYTSSLERGVGTLPLSAREQLRRYELLAQEALEIISRSLPSVEVSFEMPSSLYDREEENEEN